MATVLPDNPAWQLRFFEEHAPLWASEHEAVGLSAEQAENVVAATERAAEALAAALRARQAAKAATLAWESAAAALGRVGRQAIATIKTHAQNAGPGFEAVYAAASIAPPARPGPKRRTPDEARAALPRVRSCRARPNEFGGVDVEWTCGYGVRGGAGAGMIYRVRRGLDGAEPTLLEVVGSPGPGRRSVRFTDTTVPPGTRTVTYAIVPMRGSATGAASSRALVCFGSEPSTVQSADEPNAPLRRAA